MVDIETAGNMFDAETEKVNDAEDEVTPFYKEAFQCFDWNNSGRISTSVSSMASNSAYFTIATT